MADMGNRCEEEALIYMEEKVYFQTRSFLNGIPIDSQVFQREE